MVDVTTLDDVQQDAELSPEEATVKLSQLKASATKEYSLKNYTTAADFYSEATELQASLNGEMSPQNAELLYAYGRCLYHVAISKSDVLGTKVAGTSSEEPKKKKRKVEGGQSGDASKSAEQQTAEEIVEAVVAEKDGKANGSADKPFFQITGDENWTDSEGEEDADAEGEQGEDDEEDDFANAYEVLDLARVLLTKQVDGIDGQETDSGKGKAVASNEISGEKRAVMERLADTLDLQAEIWLESERFADAIPDFRSALDLKLKLYPEDNSLVAEAQYKLSLALEFASIRKTEQEGEAAEAGADKPPEVDEEMRAEAASHMEKAIASCRLRIQKEKDLLASSSGEERSKKERNIKEVEEMLRDLEQRLVELKNPPVLTNGGPAGAPNAEIMNGILGSILGESPAEQKTRIAEATKGANDLSGLIRKKTSKVTPQLAVDADTNKGKRRLDEDEQHDAATNGKKAKTDS